MRPFLILRRCKIVLLCALALGLTSPAISQYAKPSRGVTLYRDLNFTGTSQTFSNDIPDLRGTHVGNDTVTSVRISSGCRVRLYADAAFRGPYIEIVTDVSDLRRSPVGNDSVTSVRVRCEETGGWGSDGEGWTGRSSTPGVTLYRDLNFSGASQSFSDDVADLRSTFIGNDSVTSVRVDRGCGARLYSDVDYRGDHVDLDRDASDLRGSPVGNDTVSSIRVRCDGQGTGWASGDDGWGGDPSDYGVTLFRDVDFAGTGQTFTEDSSDLRNTFLGNDSATSVRISPGCRARLYVDANFRGIYIEIDRDISDLRGSQVGNDAITSLQVRCERAGRDWTGDDSSWAGSHRVTLYQHAEFSGNAYSFDSDSSDLRAMFGSNDEASSVRVAPGCTARLFQDPGYRGTFTETSRDIADLRSARVGNDSISSLQIRCR